MNHNTPKYHYGVQRERKLVTQVGGNPVEFVLEQMNKYGALGLRVISPPELQQEASQFSGPNGPIPNYHLSFITEQVYTGDKPPEIIDAEFVIVDEPLEDTPVGEGLS